VPSSFAGACSSPSLAMDDVPTAFGLQVGDTCCLPLTQSAPHHDVWIVEARKLRSRDKVQSHTFAVMLPKLGFGLEAVEVHFVVMIRAKMINRRRGGGSFSASKGVGFIEVKCAEDFNMDFQLSVVIGNDGQPSEEVQPQVVQHNFHETTLCRIQGEWNFLKAADAERDILNVGLHVQPCGFQIMPPCAAMAVPASLCQPWDTTWMAAGYGSNRGEDSDGGGAGFGWSYWPAEASSWTWPSASSWEPTPASAAVDTVPEAGSEAVSGTPTSTLRAREAVQWQ